MEVGHRFLEDVLPGLTSEFNRPSGATEPKPFPSWRPWSARRPSTWPCTTPIGVLHDVPTYETYNEQYMNVDLAAFPHAGARARDVSFAGRYPEEFLVRPRLETIPAWHLIGGKDPIDPDELTGTEPDDGYPVLLARLDPPRRPQVPEGQAARRRRRLGLRPAARRSARSRSRKASTGSPPTSTARSTSPPTSTRSSTG